MPRTTSARYAVPGNMRKISCRVKTVPKTANPLRAQMKSANVYAWQVTNGLAINVTSVLRENMNCQEPVFCAETGSRRCLDRTASMPVNVKRGCTNKKARRRASPVL